MIEQTAMLDALNLAMEAEQKASQFYAAAAAKTQNPKGKDLLEQLARFEQAHFEALEKVRSRMAGDGGGVAYEGTGFDPVPAEVVGAGAGPEANLDEVLEIIRLAIQAEDDAHGRYAGLAEQADDPDVQALFRKLASEEEDHRRILSDEFYQLTNADGVWRWGE